MKQNSEKISFSIISHNQQKIALDTIFSVRNYFSNAHFIVTLNTDEDGPLRDLKDKDITFILNTKPKGFSENHNFAFEKCSNEIFCVLNPDIEISSMIQGFTLSSFFELGYSFFSPKITEGFAPSDSLRNFPSLKNFISRFVGRKKDIEVNFNHGQKFDWVSGACIFFKKSAFTALNGFDQQFFMYCEDIDICRRAALISMRFCCSDALVLEHKSQRKSRKDLYLFLKHLESSVRILLRLRLFKEKVKAGIFISSKQI